VSASSAATAIEPDDVTARAARVTIGSQAERRRGDSCKAIPGHGAGRSRLARVRPRPKPALASRDLCDRRERTGFEMIFWRAASSRLLRLCSGRRAGRASGWVCLGWVLLAGCGSVSRPVRSAGALERAAARPAGTLYVSSTQFEQRTVTIIDAGTARLEVRRVSELFPGDPPYTIAVIDGQVVVYGRAGTYGFGANVREPGRLIGASWFFIPSASRGRVWLVSLDTRDRDQAHGLAASAR
jgi:hypothetical protein